MCAIGVITPRLKQIDGSSLCRLDINVLYCMFHFMCIMHRKNKKVHLALQLLCQEWQQWSRAIKMFVDRISCFCLHCAHDFQTLWTLFQFIENETKQLKTWWKILTLGFAPLVTVTSSSDTIYRTSHWNKFSYYRF